MAAPICTADLSACLLGAGSSSTPVLEGRVAGLRTVLHVIAPGANLALAPLPPSDTRVLFVASGAGAVTADGGRWRADFAALATLALAPGARAACALAAAPGQAAVALEVVVAGAPGDAAAAADAAARGALPYALPYAAAPTYSEAFKSASTVSRTLVPRGAVPRFAAGSVQAAGPDAVGEHAHPMLEQLFLGLPGCAATVTADGAEARLGAWTLLHVPLGSTHGVRAGAGEAMHYVWLDLFRDLEGERWLEGHVERVERVEEGRD